MIIIIILYFINQIFIIKLQVFIIKLISIITSIYLILHQHLSGTLLQFFHLQPQGKSSLSFWSSGNQGRGDNPHMAMVESGFEPTLIFYSVSFHPESTTIQV